MPDVLVFAAMAVLALLSLILCVTYFDGTGPNEPYWILTLGMLSLLGLWMGAYLQLEPEVEKISIVTSNTLHNIDLIIDDQNPVNLNNKLNRHIESGTKIKITRYKANYISSVGILSTGRTDTKYEVVEDDS